MSGTDLDILESPMGHHDYMTPHRGPVNLESQMKALYNAIWKEGKPFVTNESGVDILADTLRAIAPKPLVMVRSEYSQIFQYILELRASNRRRAGLVVTGHPGVGKTLFLYYALGAALFARIPVVLWERDSLCVLFDHRGVHKIRDLAAADFPRRALFLVDSNSSLHSPPGASLDPRSQAVVVQAISPETSRWESWAKHAVRASFCIMSVWTRAEMRALQCTMEALGRASWANPPPGSSAYTPLDIFDLLGPSPRVCIRMSKSVRSEGAETAFRRYFASNHVFLEFDALLRATDYPSLSNAFFELDDVDLFFHLYSAMPSNPWWEGFMFGFEVPTLFLRQKLTAQLRTDLSRAQQLRFASRSLAPPVVAAFYQPLALDALLQSQTGHTCHVLDGGWKDANFRLGPNLALRAAALDFDDAPIEVEVDDSTILVPPVGRPAPSFPFHALVVSAGKTRVTLLRMLAISETSPPPESWKLYDRELASLDRAGVRAAIDAVGKALPRPDEVQWTLAYVALRGETAKKAAKSEEARAMLGDPHPAARVKLDWLELRARDRDSDTKALLAAFEKGAQEARETREMWRPARVPVGQSLVNDKAGLSAGTGTQEQGTGAWAKARRCN